MMRSSLFFLLNFILSWVGLQGQRAGIKGQGNEWDWDAWYERHKESKSLKANKREQPDPRRTASPGQAWLSGMASYIADFFLIPQGTYIHVSKWPAYLAVPHTEVLHGHQLWDYAKVLQYVTLPSHMTQRGNSHILVPHPSSLYQNVSAVVVHTWESGLQGSRKKKTQLGPPWDTLAVSKLRVWAGSPNT